MKAKAYNYATGSEDLDNGSLVSDVEDSGGEEDHQSEEKRDEIKEVEKMTHKENRSVFVLHKVVTLMLLATAAAVTTTAYILLSDENKQNFDQAVSFIC